jgi:hypothetical protein
MVCNMVCLYGCVCVCVCVWVCMCVFVRLYIPSMHILSSEPCKEKPA